MDNKKAKEIIKEYNQYIRTVANNFKQPLYTQDLEQVGRLAAIKAHQHLKEGKNPKSYITTCIKGAMKNYLTQNARTIRIPAHQVFKMDSIPVDSLDVEINESGEHLSNNIPSEVSEAQNDNKALKNALNQLKPNRRKVIEMYFDLNDTSQPKTFREIGEELGITGQAVQQVFARAMKQLEQIMKKEKGSN
jgi:RNA polymerase sigma factor (sigma-70 family)